MTTEQQTAFLSAALLVLVALLASAFVWVMAWQPAAAESIVCSCDDIADIDGRATWAADLAQGCIDTERDNARDIEQLRQDLTELSKSVGQGDIDVACLFRGHVLKTHFGAPARAVRDRPVPGGWAPLSPLLNPPTRTECLERFP